MQKFSILFLAIFCITIVGCGGNDKNTANTNEPTKAESTETKKTEPNFEFFNGNDDYLIIAKGKDDGVVAVKSKAKKDKNDVFAIDIFRFLTENNETIGEALLSSIFKRCADMIRFFMVDIALFSLVYLNWRKIL